jgi:hypothetical protein
MAERQLGFPTEGEGSCMTRFSASDAALEGFKLIHRHWRMVLGWAGFNLLALVMLVVLTVVLGVVAAALSGGMGGSVTALAGAVAGLGAFAIQAIIAGGVFRAELRPQEPAFMHLRLGPDEFRLLAVWAVMLTGAWILVLLVNIAGRMLNLGGLWQGLAAVVVLIFVGLRFSLTAPVSFVERRVDFLRSWRLTHGQFFALLGMTVLSLSLIALVMVAVMVVLALVAAGSAGLDGIAGLFGGTESLQRHPGLYILEFAVEIILTPVLWILGLAPQIAAYQALAEAVD